MEKQVMPALETLRELFEIDTETGALYWKPPHRAAFYMGERVKRRAGSTSSRRRMVSVGRRLVQCDKIVLYMLTGEAPERVVHLDGDDMNDAPSNLRAAPLLVDGKRPLRPRKAAWS